MWPDPRAEGRLVDLAAECAGFPGVDGRRHPVAASLDRFASARTRDQPIAERTLDGWLVEAQEELADCRNYLTWLVRSVEAAFLAGDAEAADTYARAMQALVGVIRAWEALAR